MKIFLGPFRHFFKNKNYWARLRDVIQDVFIVDTISKIQNSSLIFNKLDRKSFI